jgi:ceramide glucosyltransferase
LVRRFAAGRAAEVPAAWPSVVVLKPLHGDEALLEAALASACAQDYPRFRVVCGVQDPGDAAIGVVGRLRARFPGVDIALVVDPTPHGRNRKVANLINMLAAGPGLGPDEVVVIADSDIHAAPDWLRRVVAALAVPGVGLVTTLYAGQAAHPGWVARLGCTAITHGFLPGALLARAMGRQDCLGATMALRAETLAAVGGLPALSAHLADDNELGRLVRARGLGVALAATVPTTTVAEDGLGALLSHELRWARTIRALVPAAFAASAVQYPIAWAGLAAVMAPGAATLGLLGAAWGVRAVAARGIDRALGVAGATPVPVGLLPVRDVVSVGVVLAAFAGRRVRWRGEVLEAGAVPREGPREGRCGGSR